MLILTRRIGETIIIGDNVSMTVLNVRGNQVRLGINAPKDVTVHREEIYQRIRGESGDGTTPGAPTTPRRRPRRTPDVREQQPPHYNAGNDRGRGNAPRRRSRTAYGGDGDYHTPGNAYPTRRAPMHPNEDADFSDNYGNRIEDGPEPWPGDKSD